MLDRGAADPPVGKEPTLRDPDGQQRRGAAVGLHLRGDEALAGAGERRRDPDREAVPGRQAHRELLRIPQLAAVAKMGFTPRCRGVGPSLHLEAEERPAAVGQKLWLKPVGIGVPFEGKRREPALEVDRIGELRRGQYHLACAAL
jgi:hypothetical protein